MARRTRASAAPKPPPVQPVHVRRILRLEDLAPSMRREIHRRTGGNLERVRIVRRGLVEILP